MCSEVPRGHIKRQTALSRLVEPKVDIISGPRALVLIGVRMPVKVTL